MRDPSQATWRDHWERVHDTLRQPDIYYWMDQIKLKYLLEFLPPAATTLEVGCGSSRLSVFLAQRGYRTYGIDYEPQAIRVAQNNFDLAGQEASLSVGNARALPFEEAAFDVVLSTGLLEHFKDPLPVVREMVRVVKPGGVFYSDIVPAKFSLFRALDGLRLRKWEVFEATWGKQQIANLLTSVGLERVTVFGAGVFPPLWFPLLSRYKLYHRVYNMLTRPLLPVLSRLDRTALGEVLGFYYFCVCYKPAA